MAHCRLVFTAALALLLSACYTAPIRPVALDDARMAVEAASANPDVRTFAADELQQATATYGLAESMFRRDGYSDEVRRLTYLAQQRAADAQQMAHLRYEAGRAGSAEREQAAAREREMEAARAALLEEARAESASRAAREAEAQARAAQQHSPAAAPQRAPSSAERRVPLERELRDLAATRSDRGTVVTLNDVLFEPGSATLRPGGQRLLARLGASLSDHPERTIAIEGFTDGTGTEAQGQQLSEQRAAAVRLGLVNAGVDASQVFVRGYGKAFPVASNDTPEGQRRNRRVEIVISDERGSIAPRVANFTNR
jgi:outer membrane protein OmpA-like peptidoglycan-associated protein